MKAATPPPSLKEFRTACLAGFAFLAQRGFREVPNTRFPDDRFQVWFGRDDRLVIVQGEGWGEFASTMLEHKSGTELAVVYLVPREKRPTSTSSGKKVSGQLEQIQQQAEWLEAYGSDFIDGDLTHFLSLARPLPPWKKGLTSR